jgi:hypothetical protein
MTLREQAHTIQSNADSFARSLRDGREINSEDIRAVLYLVMRLSAIVADVAPIEH